MTALFVLAAVFVPLLAEAACRGGRCPAGTR